MTPDRLHAMKATAESWGDDNPFKASLLARLGGLYRPSTATDDNHLTANQARVDHAREVAEAKAAGGCAF